MLRIVQIVAVTLTVLMTAAAHAATAGVCLRLNASSPCLTPETIATMSLEFARLSPYWTPTASGHRQLVTFVRVKPEPRDYAAATSLIVDVDQGANSESPSGPACASLKEWGIQCRTGFVESTWLSHATGAAGVLLSFHAPSERPSSFTEIGPFSAAAACSPAGSGPATATVVCSGKYLAEAFLDGNVPSARLRTGLETCVVQPLAAAVSRQAVIRCDDSTALTTAVQIQFGTTQWRNTYAVRVSDDRYNHYLTGY